MSFDLTNMTINPEEAKNISQGVYELAFAKSELANNHVIIPGIKYKTQIPFASGFGLMGKKITGCKTTPDGTLSFSEKVWSPEMVGFRVELCSTEIDQDFKLFQRQVKALDWFNEGDDEVMGYITQRGVEAVSEMVDRLVWFGDTDADIALSGGTLTAGVDPKYFDAIDGIWKQVYADVLAGKEKVSITENTLATTALQLVLAEDTALKVMRGLFAKVDPRARQSGDLKFFVSDSLALNFYDYIEDKSLGFSLSVAEDGKDVFKYRGIPIVIMYQWDRQIAANFDNGTTLDKPHRALLIAPSNMPIGTLDEGSLSEVKSFYDEYNEINVMKANVIMDVKVLDTKMYAVAY